mmetsp:Transcript_7814/g.25042  ORF Transcript_7814/g.25042 Transcript_7814/m.25042 type:complete len:414 (+) Transcript_7814:821-2062(+)
MPRVAAQVFADRALVGTRPNTVVLVVSSDGAAKAAVLARSLDREGVVVFRIRLTLGRVVFSPKNVGVQRIGELFVRVARVSVDDEQVAELRGSIDHRNVRRVAKDSLAHAAKWDPLAAARHGMAEGALGGEGSKVVGRTACLSVEGGESRRDAVVTARRCLRPQTLKLCRATATLSRSLSKRVRHGRRALHTGSVRTVAQVTRRVHDAKCKRKGVTSRGSENTSVGADRDAARVGIFVADRDAGQRQRNPQDGRVVKEVQVVFVGNLVPDDFSGLPNKRGEPVIVRQVKERRILAKLLLERVADARPCLDTDEAVNHDGCRVIAAVGRTHAATAISATVVSGDGAVGKLTEGLGVVARDEAAAVGHLAVIRTLKRFHSFFSARAVPSIDGGSDGLLNGSRTSVSLGNDATVSL